MSKKSALSSIQLYTSDQSSCSDNESSLGNLFEKENDKKAILLESNLNNKGSSEIQQLVQNPFEESVLKKHSHKKRKKISKPEFESDSDESSEIQQLLPSESSKKSIIKKYRVNDESPKSANLCKEVTTTSTLKRTYSMTENDFPILSNFSYKESEDISNISSISKHNRRSLPNELPLSPSESISKTPEQHTPLNKISKRRSFPLNLTPHSSKRSFHRSYACDQTPYSPKNSYHQRKRFKSILPSYNSSDLLTFESDQGFIDSHCHLDFLFQRQYYEGSYKDYQKKHEDTFPKCYRGCLAIFCNPFTFKEEHKWKSYIEEENVWASFGCHPHNAKDYNDQVENSLRLALEHPKVRALGEIGLDYSSRNFCMRDLQHEAFKRQLKIALEKKLPLVIHCREAHEDGMEIMKKIVPKNYFVHLHCFTDSWDVASQWLQEFPNLFIGITNVVTFPSAESVHEVAKNIPLNRLLIETDAPYFIPKPLLREFPDTRFSHPGMAIHVAAQIAAIKGMNLELVLHHVRQNTKKIYKI